MPAFTLVKDLIESVQAFICLNVGMCFKYLVNLRLGHSDPKYFHISELVPGPAPFWASFKLLRIFAREIFPFGADTVSVLRAAAEAPATQTLPGTRSGKSSIWSGSRIVSEMSAAPLFFWNPCHKISALHVFIQFLSTVLFRCFICHAETKYHSKKSPLNQIYIGKTRGGGEQKPFCCQGYLTRCRNSYKNNGLEKRKSCARSTELHVGLLVVDARSKENKPVIIVPCLLKISWISSSLSCLKFACEAMVLQQGHDSRPRCMETGFHFSPSFQQRCSQPAAPRGLGFTASVAAVFWCLQGSLTSCWKGFISAQGGAPAQNRCCGRPCSAGPSGDVAHFETISWKKPNHWLLACSWNKEKGKKEIRSNSDLWFLSKRAKMLWVYSSLTWQHALVQLPVLRFVIWRSKSPGKAASTGTELPQSHRWQMTQICRNSKQMG